MTRMACAEDNCCQSVIVHVFGHAASPPAFSFTVKGTIVYWYADLPKYDPD